MEKEYKMGDWVMYNGKPRQVYKFLPLAPTKECPAVIRDPRFDMVELMGLKHPVYVSNVRRMTVEAV